jgi:hypothetical protein
MPAPPSPVNLEHFKYLEYLEYLNLNFYISPLLIKVSLLYNIYYILKKELFFYLNIRIINI